MRDAVVLLLISALIWGGVPVLHGAVDDKGGAAFADSGSSGGSDEDDEDDEDEDEDEDEDDDDEDDEDDTSSGSGSSGSGSSASSGSGNDRSGGLSPAASVRATFGLDGIAIRFDDGHVERIRDNRFEILDPRGRVVLSRAVAAADRARLQSLGNHVKRRERDRGIEAVIEVGDHGSAIEVTDYRGWREIVMRGTYLVKDPKGRTVARRPVTAADIARLRAILAFD